VKNTTPQQIEQIKATIGKLFQLRKCFPMLKALRIKLARWILGEHCACYKMGYHPLVDFRQKSADTEAKAKARQA
jgi:hypothetical protein